jgi:regulator of sigma E protease
MGDQLAFILSRAFYLLLLLGPLVFVHELGHFVMAKRWGIRVEEFGLGYPPRLLRLGKIGETEYTVNLLPVGGFVRLLGEDDPSVPGSFAGRGKLARATTLLAGPFMNLMLAVAVYTAINMSGVAVERTDVTGVGVLRVYPDSPAATAGLNTYDVIVAVDGTPLNELASKLDLSTAPGEPDDRLQRSLQAATNQSGGNPMRLSVQRGGQVVETSVRPEFSQDLDRWAMGVVIGLPMEEKALPPAQALVRGIQDTWRVVTTLVDVVKMIIEGQSQVQVSGPAGIARIAGEVAEEGPRQLASFGAFLSVNLALINLLPIPALDGGRLLFIALEGLRRKRIDARIERQAHVIGFALLLFLLAVITFLDIRYPIDLGP